MTITDQTFERLSPVLQEGLGMVAINQDDQVSRQTLKAFGEARSDRELSGPNPRQLPHGTPIERVPLHITRYRVPLHIHIAWCAWCAEQVETVGVMRHGNETSMLA